MPFPYRATLVYIALRSAGYLCSPLGVPAGHTIRRVTSAEAGSRRMDCCGSPSGRAWRRWSGSASPSGRLRWSGMAGSLGRRPQNCGLAERSLASEYQPGCILPAASCRLSPSIRRTSPCHRSSRWNGSSLLHSGYSWLAHRSSSR